MLFALIDTPRGITALTQRHYQALSPHARRDTRIIACCPTAADARFLWRLLPPYRRRTTHTPRDIREDPT